MSAKFFFLYYLRFNIFTIAMENIDDWYPKIHMTITAATYNEEDTCIIMYMEDMAEIQSH